MGTSRKPFLLAVFILGSVAICLVYAMGTSVRPVPVTPLGPEGSLPPLKLAPPVPTSSVLPPPLLHFAFRSPADVDEWQERSFLKHTSYQIAKAEGGEPALRAYSQRGSSGLYQKIGVEIAKRPFLSWEWKVVQFPSNKQNKVFASKKDNDFGARVYAIVKKKRSPLFDVIQYVWDDHFPEGTYTTSPFSRNTRILVVQSGPANAPGPWVSEVRDVFEDYKMLFGKTPQGDLAAVGLMSDSDNTKTKSEAYYRQFSIHIAK